MAQQEHTPSSSINAMRRRGHLIFMVGAPGCGKGTNCKLIAGDAQLRNSTFHGRKVHHVSVGDLLRKQMSAGVLSPELAEKVRKQELMNGHDITSIIASANIAASSNLETLLGAEVGESVIIDGFPRNMDQLQAFRERLGDPDLVVSLACSRDIAMNRFLGRHDESRPHGDEALFVKRCDEFERENPAILEFYKGLGSQRVLEVDVSSVGIRESFSKVKQSLTERELNA